MFEENTGGTISRFEPKNDMCFFITTSHETCKAYSIARSSANILFQHKIRYFKIETNKETTDIVRASQG